MKNTHSITRPRQPNTQHTQLIISRRALSLWRNGGSPPGRDLSFWLLAEHQCAAERDTESAGMRDVLDGLFPMQDPKRSTTCV